MQSHTLRSSKMLHAPVSGTHECSFPDLMSAIHCRRWLASDVTNPLKLKVNEWFITWLPGQFEELTKLREGQAALQKQVSCTRASRHHDCLFSKF